MTPQTRELQLGVIRQLKGLITVWEKWLQAEYESGLPVATPSDVMDILSKSKAAAPPRTHASQQSHHPRE